MHVVGSVPRTEEPIGPKTYKLRSYLRVAHNMYTCDWCHVPIEPGDQYEGEVEAFRLRMKLLPPGCRRKGISVWRKHHFPLCPRDPFEDDKKYLDETQDIEHDIADAA